MVKDMHKGTLIAVAAAVTLLAGCASNKQLDEVRALADEANQTASTALSTAQQAEQTANEAKQSADEANNKIDNMFRKAMMK